MNWKRFFALLLVLALLPALFGNAFAAGPKARTLTDADYAPIDALWAELDAVEQEAQTQSAQDGPDRTLAAAQAVAKAVTASDLYVDGTLQWRGAQFSFETTTGVTCAYSPRLRELARKAAGSSVETEAVEPQTSTTTSADITLIEPYYGLDPSFTQQYQNEVKKLAAATGGSSQVLKTTRATIDAVAAAVESSGVVIFDSHGSTVAQDGNVFTVSDVREDCTLVVEFRQRTPATVVFSTPEGASQPMQRGYVGEEMALTAPEGKPLANAHDYVFAGWTDAPVADAVQVSTVYTDTYTPIRAMVTLYALYSWQDGETTRYTTQPQNKVCPSEAFSDLDVTQWYHEPVDYMLETGMMNGMSATIFEPNGTLTRAQLVTILYRHAGSPDVTGLPNPFADVAPQSWYAKAVIWAAANGVVKGTSAATFAPEDAITREQIAAILYRYNGEAVTGDLLSSFPDADAVSGYAVEAMQWAVSRGLISGDPASDGTLWLRPRDGATRAQIAKILWVWLGA